MKRAVRLKIRKENDPERALAAQFVKLEIDPNSQPIRNQSHDNRVKSQQSYLKESNITIAPSLRKARRDL